MARKEKGNSKKRIECHSSGEGIDVSRSHVLEGEWSLCIDEGMILGEAAYEIVIPLWFVHFAVA